MHFYFLIAYLVTIISALEEVPFCKICTCNTQNLETELTVKCMENVVGYIFHPSFWFNNSTNSSYPIKRVIVENNDFITLDQVFPKSPLKILDLSDNNIINITDNVFQNLQDLEELNLSNNGINFLHANSFKGQYLAGDFYPLKSLKKLYLNNNKIHSFKSEVFEHTDRLEELYLSHNPLTVIDKQTSMAITSLTYIKVLDISFTMIKELPQYFLHTPQNLVTLNLSGNLFKEIPKGLSDSRSLQTLIFNSNPIENLTVENGFPEVKQLKVLHLCNMRKLRRIEHDSLKGVPKLEELYISDNIRLTYISDSIFSENRENSIETRPPIKKLFLNNNKLTHLNMSLLGKWDTLSALDLTDNPWTCACENQWMIDNFKNVFFEIDQEKAIRLRCGAPVEMEKYTFYNLSQKEEKNMRCLDAYGARPEKDAAILIGVLAGVLISIPIFLGLIYAYRRHWFGLFDDSPAAFSRQFYSRTTSNDMNAEF